MKEAWRTSGGSDIYGFEYAYDEAGNRKLRSNVILAVTTYWEYDQGDQMTLQRAGAPTTVYFTFDNNGNLSVEHDVDASAGRTYYDYDPRNLLTRVDFPGATATNYFYYNGLGERTRKDDSTGGKKYTWDGLLPILEKNLSNTTVQRMVKGYTPISGIGEYARQELSGTSIYPHKNQVGTVMRHTDSSQTVVNTYEYDAWGVPLVVSEGTSQQFRFTGKELDPDFIAFNSENRRYHYPFRTYIPFIASFAQRDSLWLLHFDLERMGDSYTYVRSNPTNSVDPFGLQGETATVTFAERAGKHGTIEVVYQAGRNKVTSFQIPEERTFFTWLLFHVPKYGRIDHTLLEKSSNTLHIKTTGNTESTREHPLKPLFSHQLSAHWSWDIFVTVAPTGDCEHDRTVHSVLVDVEAITQTRFKPENVAAFGGSRQVFSSIEIVDGIEVFNRILLPLPKGIPIQSSKKSAWPTKVFSIGHEPTRVGRVTLGAGYITFGGKTEFEIEAKAVVKATVIH